MKIIVNGEQVDVPTGAFAYMYANPVESGETAGWLFDADKALAVAREDPSLIVWAVPSDEVG